jgi:alanine dehydrogenase
MKAATLVDDDGRAWFAAKLNANFPTNPRDRGLPTIQGVLALCDARVGTPLAIMDSIELTIVRTAAATAVAARYLAVEDAAIVAIIGCGAQARAQLDTPATVYDSLAAATLGAHIVITCTPSRSPFLTRAHLSAGAFVAAVGTDNAEKSEIDPSLMGDSAVVVGHSQSCLEVKPLGQLRVLL